MKKMEILLVLSTLFVGIMAGLFFAWSVSVMNGLAKLPDQEFILAMQSMNREIQNPIFFVFFFGSALLLPVSVFFISQNTIGSSFWLLLVASFFYLVGVIGVTIFQNVPLNEMLDTFSVHLNSVDGISAMRKKFEQPWNNWNLIRTVCNVISFLLLLIGMIKR